MQVEKVSDIKVRPLSYVAPVKNTIPEPLMNFTSRSNFILGIIAPTGSGKSVLISNLLRIYYKNVFDKVFFCSSNVNEHKQVFDNAYNSIEFDENRIFSTINNQIINHIKEEITLDEHFDEPDFRALLVIDDLITEVMKKKNEDIVKFILQSRHLKCSIILVSHKFNFIPTVIRNNLTEIILFRSKSLQEIETIYKGIIDLKKEDFEQLYEYCTSEPHSFLYSKLNKNPQLYYRNFDEKLSV